MSLEASNSDKTGVPSEDLFTPEVDRLKQLKENKGFNGIDTGHLGTENKGGKKKLTSFG